MEDFLKGFKPRPKSALYQPKKRNGRNVSRSKTSLGLRSKLSDVDGEEPDECLLIVGNRDPAEAAVGFLPTARMVFGRINTDMSRVEARDFINDWRRHQDMMKAQGHLDLSIDPNELVADKEASLALPFSSKYSDRDDSTTSSPRLQSTSGDTKDTWTSAIYEANETSKKHLFVVRFRLNYLKRQLRLRKALNMRLEKKRLQTQEYLTRKKLEVKAEESKRYEYDEEEHEEEKEWEDSDSGSDDSSLTELTVDVRKL
uniref:Uncharacterized protein LOC102805222 n=1 Tax=Saccoglossus kowalevskii TaxID=10224 RepID=A0ABM0M2A6_SACKO